MKLSRLLFVAVLPLLAISCGKKADDHDHDHADHAAHGGHAHIAPHGGILAEVGEHAYNVEFLRDATTGKLSAYILDGHAENFVRIKASTFDAIATVNGEKRPLTFKAIANAATGEAVGDTSQFDAQAEWLKSTTAVAVTIPALEIRGNEFKSITATLKP
jgi:hypothetical protein